ncbi:hypothetical protein BDV18DRAFT_161769 [Aspergillus unguis]
MTTVTETEIKIPELNCLACKNFEEPCGGKGPICDQCERYNMICAYTVGDETILASHYHILVREDKKVLAKARQNVRGRPFGDYDHQIDLPVARETPWLKTPVVSTSALVAQICESCEYNQFRDSTQPLSVDRSAKQKDSLMQHQLNTDRPPPYIHLPPKERAQDMIASVHTLLGPYYCLIHKEELMGFMPLLYNDLFQQRGQNPILYPTYLVALALALEFTGTAEDEPNDTSAAYFGTAMALLPDMHTLSTDFARGARLLALIGVYFQATDRFDSAIYYIRHALKLARSIPAITTKSKTNRDRRCQRLLSTLYCLDLTVAPQVGLFVAGTGKDFDPGIPDERAGSEDEAGLYYLCRMCRFASAAIKLAELGKWDDTSLFTGQGKMVVQTVSLEIAALSVSLENEIGASRRLANIMRRVQLLGCWCLSALARPGLLSLLKSELQRVKNGLEAVDIWGGMSDERKYLLQYAMNGASEAFRAATALHGNGQLGLMPFDAENCFTAGLTDTLLSTIFPSLIKDTNEHYGDYAAGSLFFMKHRANAVAGRRERALRLIRNLIEHRFGNLNVRAADPKLQLELYSYFSNQSLYVRPQS